MRPDKQKVIDETWDDERIKSFLDHEPPVGVTATDFALLLTAYRSMRAEDFVRFIDVYVEAGHDVDATDDAGITFTNYISHHRHAKPFIAALTDAGATAVTTTD